MYPIDLSPAWWSGDISMPFAPAEWEAIVNSLEYYMNFHHSYNDEHEMEASIVDRIKKNLGVE